MLPSFKRVDTCAAEFAAETPYLYSSYDGSDESRPSSAKKVLTLLRPMCHKLRSSSAKKVLPLPGSTSAREGRHAQTPICVVLERVCL